MAGGDKPLPYDGNTGVCSDLPGWRFVNHPYGGCGCIAF